MLEFNAKGVCGGIAIGKVYVPDTSQRQVRRIGVKNTRAETEKFERAKSEALLQLTDIYNKALKEVGEANAEIFSIHMMMLEDEDYNESVVNIIETQKVNAEYAIAVTGENFSKMFASMDDAYMRARQADVKDVSSRLIECISPSERNSREMPENSVICADDLSPSETVLIDKTKVVAFVTAKGSTNSHTAILARNMNIPAVIGAGDSFLEKITEDEDIIVDGDMGRIVLQPGKTDIESAKKKQREIEKKKRLLKSLKGKENVTLDGTKINVYANIGSVENVGDVLYNDAGGIGLFRSEFLYLENDDFPSEQQQFEVYKTVLESMAGKKVVIRTLDVGADKQAGYFGIPHEENPALGMRAIRICLTREDVFRTQLKALYRASVFGNLAIMFPMIANKWELERILEICESVKEELSQNRIAYNDKTEIGIMIETPAAAVISDILAPMVDFFSIGTNDLTQYTLACDRQNPLLERFCDTHHEALLRLIKYSLDNAHKNGAWIGICGELAADTSLTETFLKMGVDELSVSPGNILKLRSVIRSLDLKKQ